MVFYITSQDTIYLSFCLPEAVYLTNFKRTPIFITTIKTGTNALIANYHQLLLFD